MIDTKHLHLTIGLTLTWGVLPDQFDRVGLDISDGELSHFEDRWQDGTLESTAPGHSLVSIESGAGGLTKHFLNHGLDSWDPGAAANNLNTRKKNNIQDCFERNL